MIPGLVVVGVMVCRGCGEVVAPCSLKSRIESGEARNAQGVQMRGGGLGW